MGFFDVINRKKGSGGIQERPTQNPLRLSGTNTDTLSEYSRNPDDAELGQPIGRQGNDWKVPSTDPLNLISTVNGDRLQSLANTHLSDGPAPGRIPRQWKNLVAGKARETTGTPDGVINNVPADHQEDWKYVPHTFIPRGSVVARAYLRTVDDAAAIPGVYVSDPGRK